MERSGVVATGSGHSGLRRAGDGRAIALIEDHLIQVGFDDLRPVVCLTVIAGIIFRQRDDVMARRTPGTAIGFVFGHKPR